ncbi:phosphatidylethanolamine-binding protein [Pyrenochaeta sp. MPI-SDFR-AT-0127]|nr:phosphatidylethanolamine-binding protein [Pyrenochaeta sp. MPI-SDFR-AT-0127]
MSSAEDKKQILAEHKVIPNVLPDNIDLPHGMTLKWPNATLDTPAQELDCDETQPEPKIYLHPPPSDPLDNLVLIMTDPDLMMIDDTYFGQVRHWLVTNLSSNADGSLSFSHAAARSPYIGPAPLPNYVYPRLHRYIFILARGVSKVEVTPDDLRELQKPHAAAMTGKQGMVQDLKDRWGFNAQALIEKKRLEVVAANFMLVGGTLKSAAANLSMMSQAVADKIIGR